MRPVRRPGLVATDLDGTLVRDDGSVSPYTAEVLARVEAAGHRAASNARRKTSRILTPIRRPA